MSNPFLTNPGNNTKSPVMLLDRIVAQSIQNPNRTLMQTNSSSSPNQNQDFNSNLASNNISKVEAIKTQSYIKKTRSLQIPEDIKIQHTSSDGRKQKHENNKQNNKLFQKQQNRPLNQEKIQKNKSSKVITIKMLSKTNSIIGQLNIRPSFIFQLKGNLNDNKNTGKILNNESIKILQVKISQGYKQQLKKMRRQVQQINQQLDLCLASTNIGILSQIQKNPNKSLPQNIIKRLKIGLKFYQHDNHRQQLTRMLLQQNTEINNPPIVVHIRKISEQYKISLFTSLYAILHNPKIIQQGGNFLHGFLLQDQVNLARIYKQINRVHRISKLKLIRTQQQIQILQQTTSKYCKNYREYIQTSPELAQLLGSQLINLLTLYLTAQDSANSSYITADQLKLHFLPMLKNFQYLINNSKDSVLKMQVDSLFIEVLVRWGRHLQGLHLGAMHAVINYFMQEYKHQFHSAEDVQNMVTNMTILQQFSLYNQLMLQLVVKKLANFSSHYQSKPASKTPANKYDQFYILLQSILLLKQYSKICGNTAELVKLKVNKEYLQGCVYKIVRIIYQRCPICVVGILVGSMTEGANTVYSILRSAQVMQEMLLPLLFSHHQYNNSSHMQTGNSTKLPNNRSLISIKQINEVVPFRYRLQSDSEQYIIIMYITIIIEGFSRNQTTGIAQVEQLLSRYRIGSFFLDISGKTLQIVKLMTKYIENYAKKYQYVNPNLISCNPNDLKNSTYQHEITTILAKTYTVMQALIEQSRQQYEQKQAGELILSGQKVLRNIYVLGICIIQSCLVPATEVHNYAIQYDTNIHIGTITLQIKQYYNQIMQIFYLAYSSLLKYAQVGGQSHVVLQNENDDEQRQSLAVRSSFRKQDIMSNIFAGYCIDLQQQWQSRINDSTRHINYAIYLYTLHTLTTLYQAQLYNYYKKKPIQKQIKLHKKLRVFIQNSYFRSVKEVDKKFNLQSCIRQMVEILNRVNQKHAYDSLSVKESQFVNLVLYVLSELLVYATHHAYTHIQQFVPNWHKIQHLLISHSKQIAKLCLFKVYHANILASQASKPTSSKNIRQLKQLNYNRYSQTSSQCISYLQLVCIILNMREYIGQHREQNDYKLEIDGQMKVGGVIAQLIYSWQYPNPEKPQASSMNQSYTRSPLENIMKPAHISLQHRVYKQTQPWARSPEARKKLSKFLNSAFSDKQEDYSIMLSHDVCKIQVLMGELCVGCGDIIGVMQELGYVPQLAYSIHYVLKYYAYNSGHQSMYWLVRSLNVYHQLFTISQSLRMTTQIANTMTHSILKLIQKSSNQSIKQESTQEKNSLESLTKLIKSKQLVKWMNIILPIIHKGIRSQTSNNQYKSLLGQVLIFLSKQQKQKEEVTQQQKQQLYYIQLTQLLMIYLSHQQIIMDMFPKGTLTQTKNKSRSSNGKNELQQILLTLLKIIYKCLNAFNQCSLNTMYKNADKHHASNLQKWLHTICVCALKVAQFLNIFCLINRNKVVQLSKYQDQLSVVSQKLINLINKIQGQSNISKNIKAILESTCQLLQTSLAKQEKLLVINNKQQNLNNKRKNRNQQHPSVNYLNQALIDILMRDRESFQSTFSLITNQICSSRHSKDESNKYRQFYLLYYCLHNLLSSSTYTPYLYTRSTSQHLNPQPNPIIQASIKQLINHITQDKPLYDEMPQNAWNIIILARLIKLRPDFLKAGAWCGRVVRYCLKCLEGISVEVRSEGLDQWFIYIQAIATLAIIFRTHSHTTLSSQHTLQLINHAKTLIFNRAKDYTVRWQSTSMSTNNRGPIINEGYTKWWYPYIRIPKETDIVKQRVLANQNVQNYMKLLMVMISLCSVLNLGKLDVFAYSFVFSGRQQMFKIKFIQFVQHILGQFAKMYDKELSESPNPQALNKCMQQYLKDHISSKTQCYLNKPLCQYFQLPQIKNHPLLSKQSNFSSSFGSNMLGNASRIGLSRAGVGAGSAGSLKMSVNMSNRKSKANDSEASWAQLPGAFWYNAVEDCLYTMGANITFKFSTNGGNNMRKSTIMHNSKRMYN